jgi:hypothetical protein
MFLWVKRIFKDLNQCFSGQELRYAIKHAPRDLGREYSRFVTLGIFAASASEWKLVSKNKQREAMDETEI